MGKSYLLEWKDVLEVIKYLQTLTNIRKFGTI